MEDLKEHLTEEEYTKLQSMPKWKQGLLFSKVFPKLFNQLCEKDKQYTIKNPKRQLSTYCNTCRTKIMKKLRGYLK